MTRPSDDPRLAILHHHIRAQLPVCIMLRGSYGSIGPGVLEFVFEHGMHDAPPSPPPPPLPVEQFLPRGLAGTAVPYFNGTPEERNVPRCPTPQFVGYRLRTTSMGVYYFAADDLVWINHAKDLA